MARIKGDPAAQLAYLEKQDEALRKKAGGKPAVNTKASKKDHGNAQLAAKLVANRLETARRNAAARGITAAKPAKATGQAAEKPPEK